MMTRTLIAALLVSANSTKAPVLHQPGDFVTFGSAKSLKFVAKETPNKIPTVSLLDANGRSVLTFAIGKSETGLFEVPEEADDRKPLLQSFVVPGPSGDLDVLVPIVMVVGGSDCGYEASVVGSGKRGPKEWLRKQAFVNSQGGFYVGDLGGGRGYGFAAWNFLWEDGAHYGAHRYEVNLYRFVPDEGKAVRITHLETKDAHDDADGALRELGLNYKNLLTQDKSFSC